MRELSQLQQGTRAGCSLRAAAGVSALQSRRPLPAGRRRLQRRPGRHATGRRAAGGVGASTLKVDGKIFAMLARGELVLKLSRQHVDDLVASGLGMRFDPGHGRLMKEWVVFPPARGSHCRSQGEARRFVGTRT